MTGARHQLRTTLTYDQLSRVVREDVVDLYDPSQARFTSRTFDSEPCASARASYKIVP